MTKEELASMLNGRSYEEDITDEEERIAKDNGLVIMMGNTFGGVNLYGALHDEVDAYNEFTILFFNGKRFEGACHYGDQCGTLDKVKELPCIKFVEVTCNYDMESEWKFETSIPHAYFESVKDGKKFYSGIVFDINSIKGN